MEWLTGPMSNLFGSVISGIGSMFGAKTSADKAAETAAKNIAYQKDFAQHGLGWRIEDAVAHGLSPLVGAGAQPGPSFSNVVGDPGIGEGISKLGQELGRAVSALGDKPTRAEVLNERMMELKIKAAEQDITHQQLINSKLATTLAPAGTGPGVPLPPLDPRGAVLPLVQRFRDPRTGEIVWLPSEKAASPLQTLAASPTNLALAGRGLTEGMVGFDRPRDMSIRPDVARALTPSSYWYTPF